MAVAVAETEWLEPLFHPARDPAWNAQVKRTLGVVARVHDYIAAVPWLRVAFLEFAAPAAYGAAPARLVKIAYLVSAQENACRYCYGVARSQLKLLGFDDAWLDRVQRDADLAGTDERERALLRFCRSLARSDPRPGRSEREQLERLGWSPLAVVEITHAIAVACFANRIATFIALPAEVELESVTSGALGHLLRPVVRWWLRRLESRPPLRKTVASAAEEEAFGPLVALLEGFDGAWSLREAIRAAYESPLLPRRTKAWIFAVVGRAIGCHLCGREALRLLAAEGISAAQAERVLSLLAGPPLDATESLILPWARETVHYRVPAIQRRTRELAHHLPREVLLEAVGIAALANACARLGVLER